MVATETNTDDTPTTNAVSVDRDDRSQRRKSV
jgi:hypothetical protein